MGYLIIYEKGENSYGAYAPDLPGCGVVGDTIEEAAELIDEAIDIHIEGLKKAGEVVPKPTPILSVAPSEFIAMGVKKVNQEKNEHQRNFEEIYEAVDKLSEEYSEFFKALEAIQPTDFPVFIESGNTTTPYGDPESAELE